MKSVLKRHGKRIPLHFHRYLWPKYYYIFKVGFNLVLADSDGLFATLEGETIIIAFNGFSNQGKKINIELFAKPREGEKRWLS